VVQLDELALISVEVKLYGISKDSDIGHEVTVNFFAPSIQNDGVFYTDSNALEMQKRVINYRNTYELVTVGSTNITANFYPIQSAISIIDEET
jgi:lysosomal alpha-mannosidase